MSIWKKIGRMAGSRLALNLYVWLPLLNILYNNNRAYLKTHSAGYLVHVAGMLALLFLAIYGNTLLLLPYFLDRRKYGKAFLMGLLSLLPLCLVVGLYSEWLIHAFPGTEKYFFSPIIFIKKTPDLSWWEYYVNIYIDLAFTVFVFTIGFLARHFFKERKQKEELQQRQSASELALLKSQVNPHFLFNVLNSIYALSLKKSDEAPRIILKVSDILRYMLYESQNELVPLEQELQILRDYTDIEKVRLAQSSNIRLNCRGQLEGYRIAPALLLAFVENGIKHGLDSMAEHAFLDVSLHMDHRNNLLYFHCFNNYKNGQEKKARPGGIGLENTRKRLELIYGKKHNLHITDKNGTFDVKLEINLSAHELPHH